MNNNQKVVIAAVVFAGILDFCANWLAAHYLIAIGIFLIPAGTFAFALTFTTYDYIRRQGGIQPTCAAILLGFTASIVYAVALGGGIGRIAVAGIVALVFSSSSDLVMQTLTLRWPIWRYVATSNFVSLLIDSVVFTAIAFAMLPLDVRIRICEGQYLAKIAMTVVSIPLVYGIRRWGDRQPNQLAIA